MLVVPISVLPHNRLIYWVYPLSLNPPVNVGTKRVDRLSDLRDWPRIVHTPLSRSIRHSVIYYDWGNFQNGIVQALDEL